MSRSLDQSRPFRAGRHRAEPAPVITTPLPPTSSDAEVHPPGPPTEPASTGLRRRRDRRPAFEIPPAPESAPAAEAASPVTEAIPAVAPRSSVPESALRAAPAATSRVTARREAAEQPAQATPVAAPGSGPATARSPQVATAFTSDAQAVLGRAASVRVMGHRMAVVAGALGVLLAVGAAGQATELPFFGKESSAQDARGATDATRATLGTQPTYASGRATPRPSTSTPPGTPGAAPSAAQGTGDVPAAADPDDSALPAVADLPMPVDAPTLAGILAASPAAVAPSSGPSVELQPPVISSAPPAAPSSPAAAAPAPSPTATAPTPVAASPAPSPTPTATSPEAGDGISDEAVDTRAYASARLASFGWGAEQMDALMALWDTSIEWRPSQVDRGLSYIKERYGSPAKALEFRAANNWF